MTEPEDEFQARMAARVGTTLGKYTLKKLIGVGGMASVYAGSHRNGNPVAVKVLHPQLCALADVRTRFLREGYVANKVGHKGAVRVLDDDVASDGSVLLVMELLDGETVEERAVRAGGALDLRETTGIARQLLEVLAMAHKNGIVHRDIKPENLFLDREGGLLKVLDFGIARLNDGGAQATRSGRLMGTPVYMAPEQARGMTREIDGQTDVWAVGATMFRLLTGRYVYEAETPEMVIVYAATQPPRKIGTVLPQLPAAAARIIDTALAAEKKERWPSAEAMLAALRELPEAASMPRVDATAAPSTVALPPGSRNGPHGYAAPGGAVPVAPITPAPITPAPLTPPAMMPAGPPPSQQRTVAVDPRRYGTDPSRGVPTPSEGQPVQVTTMNNVSRTGPGVSPSRSPVVVVVGIGALLAGFLGVGVLYRSRSWASHEPPGASTTASSSTASAAVKGGGLRVRSKIAGAKLYVDDREIGPLPQEVRDLPPGERRLRIEGAIGYEPLTRAVEIRAGELVDLGEVELKVRRVRLSVSVDPAGASAVLVRGTTRRELAELPTTIELEPTDGWELRATKPGFTPATEKITVDELAAEKRVAVTLLPLSGGRPAPPAVRPSDPPVVKPAATRDCNTDRIDPKTDKVRPECVGK